MTTPARRQYLEIKGQYQDTLLAFQVGDFFEFFDDDARIAARELHIVLTARAYGADEPVPLAGVPVHAVDTYVARLVAKGYRVAICEQISPPGRGLVRREVTRILTPGTVVEPGLLPSTRDNYLVAVALGPRDRATGHPTSAGLAYVEASTGAFVCTQWNAEDGQPGALPDALHAELQRLAPAEVLVAEGHADERTEGGDGPDGWLGAYPLTPCPEHYFETEGARIRLARHFQTPTLAAFGCADLPLAIAAASAIVAYLERMHPALLRLLTGLRTYSTQNYVEIDGRTWRALEVVEPAHGLHALLGGVGPAGAAAVGGARSATLLATLDATRTPMGARLLRRTLLHPLRDRAAIEGRLDAVAALHADRRLRERIGGALDGLGDLGRLIARVVAGAAVPREAQALTLGLRRVPTLIAELRECEAPALVRLRAQLDPCDEVTALIERAVADPRTAGGRLLCEGYSAELDELTRSAREARQWIAALETSERERTGIKSLKVGFNAVFGYSIEVTRPNLARVPPEYQRRQTLATGERYVTAELKEHEALVLHAEEQIAALEHTLYAEVLREVAAHQSRMRATAEALAQADVWLALAEVAVARGYVRPQLCEGTALEISGGRHPIVEATLDGDEFIPNDIALASPEDDPAGARMVLLTGPNMAGKSTYLRQVASIVLLAQIGSFVPATHARIGLVDRIFTRVGAEDDLARGLSTFMLEMVETAYILRHATERSLVVLDEVGRGTSTGDGLAIARAVLEHLHERIGARTLFATHYHELAGLAHELPRLRVCRMAMAEHEGSVVFLHRIEPGASGNSYGVQVARMAGLPATVTQRAAHLLAASEANDTQRVEARGVAEARESYALPDADTPTSPERPGASGTANGHHEFTLALASLNIAAMTPLDALNVLFSLQQRALAMLHGGGEGRRSGGTP